MVVPGITHDVTTVLDRLRIRWMNGTTFEGAGSEELGEEKSDGSKQEKERPEEILLHVSSARDAITPTTSTRKSSLADTPRPAPGSSQLSPVSPMPTQNAILSSMSREDNPDIQTVRSIMGTGRGLFSASQSSVPAVTIQVVSSKPSRTSISPTISIVALINGGAKIDSEALPGTNQDIPVLDAAPKVAPLAKPGSTESAPPAPVATVGRPMPGKNQPKPDLDAAAAASLMVANGEESQSTLSATGVFQTQLSSSTRLALSAQSSSLTLPSSSMLSFAFSSSVQTSFVSITQTEQGKEQVPITSVAAPTPQSVSVVEGPSTLLSSIIVAATSIAIPAKEPSSTPILTVESQRESRLTPLARTLFITFGVLGAVTLLVAFGIIIMMRANKKRSNAGKVQQSGNPYDGRSEQDQYRVTTHISASNYVGDNPFLTPSEKAIVTRAASADGEHDHNIMTAGSRFADAINTFIAKSRRLTYKISP